MEVTPDPMVQSAQNKPRLDGECEPLLAEGRRRGTLESPEYLSSSGGGRGVVCEAQEPTVPLSTAVGKSKMTSARLPMDVWMGAPAFTFGRLSEGMERDHVVRYATECCDWPHSPGQLYVW